MIKTKISFLLWVLSLNVSLAQGVLETITRSPNYEGYYLGQTPPGTTAQIFAPGIVNTKAFAEYEGMVGMDNGFYFVRSDGEDKPSKLMAITYLNNKWQESVIMEDVSEPSISADQKTIHLKRKYLVHEGGKWSELKALGVPFADLKIMRLSSSANGSYYFDTFSKALDVPIRCSRLINGRYEAPRSLGEQFGVGMYNAHPYIAPDESYIIWDSIREDGFGGSDLYISFREAGGAWGPALNLGEEINTPDHENYPSVSPDGKYLFFDKRPFEDRDLVDIYWVDALIIETLRPKP